jgi:hypothetical protein
MRLSNIKVLIRPEAIGEKIGAVMREVPGTLGV